MRLFFIGNAMQRHALWHAMCLTMARAIHPSCARNAVWPHIKVSPRFFVWRACACVRGRSRRRREMKSQRDPLGCCGCTRKQLGVFCARCARFSWWHHTCDPSFLCKTRGIWRAWARCAMCLMTSGKTHDVTSCVSGWGGCKRKRKSLV